MIYSHEDIVFSDFYISEKKDHLVSVTISTKVADIVSCSAKVIKNTHFMYCLVKDYMIWNRQCKYN